MEASGDRAKIVHLVNITFEKQYKKIKLQHMTTQITYLVIHNYILTTI